MWFNELQPRRYVGLVGVPFVLVAQSSRHHCPPTGGLWIAWGPPTLQHNTLDFNILNIVLDFVFFHLNFVTVHRCHKDAIKMP